MAIQPSARLNWSVAREKLKEAYGILRDEDLSYEPGREQELCDRLSRRLQLPSDSVQRMLESFRS